MWIKSNFGIGTLLAGGGSIVIARPVVLPWVVATLMILRGAEYLIRACKELDREQPEPVHVPTSEPAEYRLVEHPAALPELPTLPGLPSDADEGAASPRGFFINV